METVRYVINGANQIACVDADGNDECNDPEVTWQYDAYGNLLTDGTNTYVYDAANRLSSISNASGTTTYAYNGDGDRISQSVNGTLTTYVLDTATPLTMVLSESTGSQTMRYWHGLDTLAQSNGSSVETFAYDGLGSVRQLVDASGALQLAQTFDPYGNGYSKAGSAGSSFGYSGEQVDANGFVFLRARYYNPSMGRFFQMDPSRQEKNAYLYSASNPVMFTDPSGLVVGPPRTRCQLDPIGCLIAWLTGTELKPISEMSPLEKAALQASWLPGPSMVAGPGISLAGQAGSVITQETITYGLPAEVPLIADGTGPGISAIGAGKVGGLAQVGKWFLCLIRLSLLLQPTLMQNSIENNQPSIDRTKERIQQAQAEREKENNRVYFYSVQRYSSYQRLFQNRIGASNDWPTSPEKAHLGPGLYAWGSLMDANTYAQRLTSSGASGLFIVPVSISAEDLSMLNRFDVPLDDDAANAWLGAHSSLFGSGISHGYDYVTRMTGLGFREHYFSMRAFMSYMQIGIPIPYGTSGQ